jgi:hypothetical protein
VEVVLDEEDVVEFDEEGVKGSERVEEGRGFWGFKPSNSHSLLSTRMTTLHFCINDNALGGEREERGIMKKYHWQP